MSEQVDYLRLQPGLIISYQIPSNAVHARSGLLWYGRIVDVSRSLYSPVVGFCYVKVLDEKLDGMTEIVFFDQIVGVFT